MIKQYDAYLSSIVFVDNSGSDIYGIFPGEARSWSNPAVCVCWDHPAETGFDHGLSSCWDNCLLGGTNIITGSKFGSLFGDDSIFIEFLDKEFTDLLANLFSLVFHNFPPNFIIAIYELAEFNDRQFKIPFKIN